MKNKPQNIRLIRSQTLDIVAGSNKNGFFNKSKSHKHILSLNNNSNSNNNENIDNSVPDSASSVYEQQLLIKNYISYLGTVTIEDMKKMTEDQIIIMEQFCLQCNTIQNSSAQKL